MLSEGLKKSPSRWVWAVSLISFALVCVRVLRLGPPEVFADEYAYPMWAKHLVDGTPLTPFTAGLNNWVYLRVMGLAFVDGGNTLLHARFINAIVAALSAAPVFLIMARRGSLPLAGTAGVLYAVFCAGNHAAYFMPEAMFFSAFAWLCLFLVNFIKRPDFAHIAVMAVFIAVMSQIKVHAMFLLPSILLTIFATLCFRRRAWLTGFSYCISFLVLSLAANLALSFALSPAFTFNIMGGLYGGIASTSTKNLSWLELLQVITVTFNHMLVILPLAIVPLVFIGAAVARAWREGKWIKAEEFEWAMFCVFVVLALATVICVTSLFTVAIANGPYSGAYESLDRLHGRYYEYALALVIFVGWASAVRLRLGFALPVAFLGMVLTAFSVRYIVHHGWASPVDFSMVYSAFAGRRGLIFFVLFAIGSCLSILPFMPRARLLMVLTGAAFFVMNAHAIDMIRKRTKPVAEDKMSVPGDQQSKIVILAHSMDANVYRAAYTLIDRRVEVLVSNSVQCAAIPLDAVAIVSLQNIGPECGYLSHYEEGRVWVGLRPAQTR